MYQNCPTAALHEKENIDDVYEKLKDENTVVLVQTAPAVRVALGEEFGMKVGTNVAGKMVTALKRLGFDKVFDTNTGADFTIMEEASEFINRVLNSNEDKNPSNVYIMLPSLDKIYRNGISRIFEKLIKLQVTT